MVEYKGWKTSRFFELLLGQSQRRKRAFSEFAYTPEAVGRKYGYFVSARHSHCRGQGFDSPMLHNENGHPSRVSIFVVLNRESHPLTEDNAKHWRGKAAEGLQWRKSRRRLSQPKRSNLSSGELRLLRLRNRGSTPLTKHNAKHWKYVAQRDGVRLLDLQLRSIEDSQATIERTEQGFDSPMLHHHP